MTAAPLETHPPSLDTLLRGVHGNVIWLVGGNFSGRTDTIQALADKVKVHGGHAILIPPDIRPALSGLVPTVKDELLLHLGLFSADSIYWCLANKWGLRSLDDRDPSSLSGGQQALLVILCKLAQRPSLLGLDGAFEQLDPENVSRVLAALNAPESLPSDSVAVIAHYGEWPDGIRPPCAIDVEQVRQELRHLPPPPISISDFCPHPVLEPATLEFRNTTFSYPKGEPVFSRLNLILAPGRIYRLVGKNGAGKSTFARLLCGILRLTSGSILVNGRSFDPYKQPGTLARLHFQNPDAQLFGEPVANELKSLPADQRQPACRFAGLDALLATHPFDLPYVLRKRLALTLILHTDSPWLIFDEPSVGIDFDGQQKIAIALQRLAAAGYGVLCITHNPRFAALIKPETLTLQSTQ